MLRINESYRCHSIATIHIRSYGTIPARTGTPGPCHAREMKITMSLHGEIPLSTTLKVNLIFNSSRGK